MKTPKNAGFFKLIIILAIVIALLAYWQVDLRGWLEDHEAWWAALGQFLGVVYERAVQPYIIEPAAYFWDKIKK